MNRFLNPLIFSLMLSLSLSSYASEEPESKIDFQKISDHLVRQPHRLSHEKINQILQNHDSLRRFLLNQALDRLSKSINIKNNIDNRNAKNAMYALYMFLPANLSRGAARTISRQACVSAKILTKNDRPGQIVHQAALENSNWRNIFDGTRERNKVFNSAMEEAFGATTGILSALMSEFLVSSSIDTDSISRDVYKLAELITLKFIADRGSKIFNQLSRSSFCDFSRLRIKLDLPMDDVYTSQLKELEEVIDTRIPSIL